MFALPSRHCLCIAGDFNTDLVQESPFVGCTHSWKGKRRTPAQDQGLFQQLLRSHFLHVINSWSNQSTFVDPAGSASRVDYILVPPLQATGHRAIVQPQIHFAPWRTGARHLPLLGQVDLKAWQRFQPRQPLSDCVDQPALCQACRPGTA